MSATGKPEPSQRGARMLDIEAQVAARIAMSRGLSQRAAEKWLYDAIAMRDRLPRVGPQLRDGTITPRQFRLILTRTELLDDRNWGPQVDLTIADTLRRRGGAGVWSNKRLIDMVDRIIFRHDPDSVRRRHEKAKQARSVWVLPDADGMASLGASMTAQDAAIALDSICRLAALVCPQDPRTAQARQSDAMFALLTGQIFECDCARPDCTSQVPGPKTLAGWLRDHQGEVVAKGRVPVHVIADQATVEGDADNPAFPNGHGVISAAHLRDLLAREDTRVRPLNKPDTADASLPTYLPSDPYRPSTALDTFVRARDGYCTAPGCDRPAWSCDIDHITEYDHDNPARGGSTHPDGLAAKCRLHHLLKTFGDGWLDDQFGTPDGRLVSEVVSPEGIGLPGFRGTIRRRDRRAHRCTCAHRGTGPRPSTPAAEPSARPTARSGSPTRNLPSNRRNGAAARTRARPTGIHRSEC